MIVISVQVKVRPENRAQFIEAIQKDRHLALQLPGCTRFVWAEDVDTPNQFMLYEAWETQDAFDTYRYSEGFKALGAVLFPLMDGAPLTNYYTAAPLAS
jgi:(4S)-4-hydroxy-5-phosphonooxypentane-2,3-dione isomerase